MKVAFLALNVSLLTLISRIFGYARDIAIAFFLGAGALNDAFIVALRLPNTFRAIFGEGALNASFVPLFNEQMRSNKTGDAKNFATSVQAILLISTIIITIFMMLFIDQVLMLIAPGIAGDPEVFKIAHNLCLISFPYLIFVSLMAFYGGICNSLGNYLAFASAPIILNITLCVFVLFGETQVERVYWLTVGVPVAGVAEFLWVLFFVYRRFGLIKLARPVLTPAVRTMFRRFLPAFFTSGITQINIVVSTMIASFVEGGISYLYYADRVYQLPLALIGTALGTVLLPELSKKNFRTGSSKFKLMQSDAVVLALFLTLPVTAVLWCFSTQIVEILFMRGEFTNQAVLGTAFALQFFILALPFYCLIKIFTAAFFAIGDTKTPFKVSVVSLFINIAVSFTFLPILRHGSVALGSLLAALFTSIMLAYHLERAKLLPLFKRHLIMMFKLILIALACASLMIYGSIALGFSAILEILVIGGIGGIMYLILSYFTNAFPLRKLLHKIKAKRAHKKSSQ